MFYVADATRLYQGVYAALSRYFDRHRQGDDFVYDSLCIDDANDAIAYMFGKKFKRNKIDIVELIGQLDGGCADFSDSDHYLLSKLNKSYNKIVTLGNVKRRKRIWKENTTLLFVQNTMYR